MSLFGFLIESIRTLFKSVEKQKNFIRNFLFLDAVVFYQKYTVLYCCCSTMCVVCFVGMVGILVIQRSNTISSCDFSSKIVFKIEQKGILLLLRNKSVLIISGTTSILWSQNEWERSMVLLQQCCIQIFIESLF